MSTLAETLVAQFERMVRRDGGEISLLGVEDGLIRVGYRPGSAEECESGACVLPHLELQTLMRESLARRAPEMRLRVELQNKH
ncbi:MAG: NifU family protein [Hyphomonadaceae bacterium]|nr:NifU family protein [Hyphomonadaceae bacterium]